MDLTDIQPNDLAGLIIAEAMVAFGISDIVLSPGSRSTPFTYAFSADDRLKKHLIIDERSAGFYALGIAKKSNNPVLLVCTSGSAAANYLPAVVEARYSRTPLIILSADRPMEQWECHAGQTIRQPGLFNSFLNWETELAEPKSTEGYLRYLRETLRQAVACSKSPCFGVVHLNAPLAEPLTPTLFDDRREIASNHIRKLLAIPSIGAASSSTQFPCAEPLVKDLSEFKKLLVVVGQNYDKNESTFIDDIFEIQSRSGAVVLADALNPLRNAKENISVLKNYDFFLRAPDVVDTLKPDVIVQIGNLPTSKILRSTMEKWDAPLIQVGDNSDNQDPSFSRKIARIQSISSLFELLPSPEKEELNWIDEWTKREVEIQGLIESETNSGHTETESMLCRQLPDYLSSDIRLMVSNSMIVRDLDVFWKGSSSVVQVISNRGANGIDGIVSTAFGVARGENIPTICIIGDLAFLHDAGSLVLKNQLVDREKLVFVLLDNHGGGIFEHLPISKQNPPFEEYFATPQDVEIEPLCKAYGLGYHSPDSLDELASILPSYFDSKETGALCIHLRFERKTSYQFRKRIASKIQDLLREKYELTVE